MDPVGVAQKVIAAIKFLYGVHMKTKENQEQCRQLCEHATLTIEHIVEKCGQDVPRPLAVKLDRLAEDLHRIALSIRELSKTGYIKRVINRNSITKQIEEAYKDIDNAVKDLDLSIQIDTARFHTESEEARQRDFAALHESFEQMNLNDDKILDKLEVQGERMEEMHETMMAIHKYMSALPADFTLERAVMKKSMTAMTRISGRMRAIPDESTITSLEILIHRERKLGQGGYAKVYEASWNGARVAVKELMQGGAMFSTVLKNEIDVWKRLRNPHILEYYGACTTSETPFIVCGLKSNGDAMSYLHTTPGANRRQLLCDASLGLAYLHRNGIVHGDLKGCNILVDDQGRACLSDFGLSKIKTTTTTMQRIPSPNDPAAQEIRGTIQWMSPEVMRTGKPTKKSDIYGFGMTMYEIFTGDPPFGILPDHILFSIVASGTRPPRPEEPEVQSLGLSDAIWSLITQCWQQEPKNRGSAEDITQALADPSSHTSSVPTVEVGIWGPEPAHNRKGDTVIQFSAPSDNTPQVFTGITLADFHNTKDMSIRSLARDIEVERATLQYEVLGHASYWGTRYMWLKLSGADQDIQCGRVDTAPERHAVRTISFRCPYTEIPKVAVWVDGIDTFSGADLHFRVWADNVSPSGFTLHVQSFAEADIGAGVAWLAHTASRTDITSGSYSSTEDSVGIPPDKKSGVVTFEGTRFKDPPIIFTAISGCEVSCDSIHVRMALAAHPDDLVVTSTNLRWGIQSWGACSFLSGEATYIAFAT